MSNMKSAILEIRSASSEDILPACEMMWQSYTDIQHQVDVSYFESYQLNDPSFQPELLRILWIDNRMAATVRVFLREIWDGRDYQLVSGIGSVATHPDFRGKGYAAMLLADTMKRVADSGASCSLLYTAIVGLYERFGFRHHTRTDVSGEVLGTPAPLNGCKDVTLAKTIRENKAALLPGMVMRSDRYWDMWIRGFKLRAADVVYSAAEDAYLIYSEDPVTGEIRIVDGACVGDAKAISRLIRQLFSGRQVGVYDVEESHLLASAVRQSADHFHEESVRHLMVLSLDHSRTPSKFFETEIDYF